MTENSQNLSIEQRLLLEKQRQEKQGTMVPFNHTVIEVGIPVREHFPNIKDGDGKTVYEEVDGQRRAKKSDQSDGFSYTFAVFGQKQFVQVVLPKKVKLEPARPYRVTGFGYNLGMNFYIKQEPKVTNY